MKGGPTRSCSPGSMREASPADHLLGDDYVEKYEVYDDLILSTPSDTREEKSLTTSPLKTIAQAVASFVQTLNASDV